MDVMKILEILWELNTPNVAWLAQGPRPSMHCGCCHALVFLISQVLRMYQILPRLDELPPMLAEQHGC